MINGNTTQSVSIKYVLQPKKTGTITIGPASIRSGSSILKTEPITIQVSERTASNQDGEEEATDINSYLKKHFYIKAEISDRDIYKGETTTVTYKLYINTGSDIYDYRVNGATKVPDYNGFFAEEIDVSNSKGSYEYINGQRYLIQTIKQVRLTPQTDGDLKIDPLTVDATIAIKVKQQNSNGLFDEFFGSPFSSSYKRYNYESTAPSVSIKVRDFPANAPESFNGAVGKFTMETSINDTITKTGEPLTYTVTVKGSGNMSLFAEPEIILPPGWDAYNPDIEERGNQKTYAYLLIPGSVGSYTLPPHEWTYFDPDARKYITLKSDEYNIQVEQGSSVGNSGNGSVSEDVEQLDKDIRFIKKDKPALKGSGSQVFNPLVLFTGVGVPLLMVVMLGVLSRRKGSESDVLLRKNKQAGKVARQRLKQAEVLAGAANSKDFYNEAVRVIWGYLGDKFHLPQSELNKENINQALVQKEVSTELIQSTLELQQKLEQAVFAPSISGFTPQDILRQLEQWIIEIEKSQSS
jgi:hypothetical protein